MEPENKGLAAIFPRLLDRGFFSCYSTIKSEMTDLDRDPPLLRDPQSEIRRDGETRTGFGGEMNPEPETAGGSIQETP